MYRITASLLFLTVGSLAAPRMASAQQTDRNPLAIHGHFTQGIGRSADMPINGIPTSLTTDYRAAALQFR